MKCCLFCTCAVLSSVPQLESEPTVEQIGETPEDVPFTIPEKWKWVNLSEVVISRDGERRPVKKSDRDNKEKIYDYYGATGIIDKIDSYLFDETLLLVGEDGANLLSRARDNAFIASGKYWVNNHAHVLEPRKTLVAIEYLQLYLSFISLAKYVTGSAQPKLTQKNMMRIPVPLPSVSEQQRIVAKLNEILPLVETYGKEKEALDKTEKEFPDKLRASLLQEAIQGKLVPQLESEPEVTQIGEAPEDVPFAIPEKWKWISASYVQTLVRGITFPASAKTKMQTHKSICCLTTGSVQEKYASKADVFVDQSFMKNTRQILQVGDVVISSANSKELVGKSILWEDDSGIQKTFGGFLTVARVKDSQTMIPEYLFLVYRYMFKTGYFANLSTQTTNIANLSNKLLDSLVFPIPPLEEQHRIAAKLNELLGAVVQLENTISAT